MLRIKNANTHVKKKKGGGRLVLEINIKNVL